MATSIMSIKDATTAQLEDWFAAWRTWADRNGIDPMPTVPYTYPEVNDELKVRYANPTLADV